MCLFCPQVLSHCSVWSLLLLPYCLSYWVFLWLLSLFPLPVSLRAIQRSQFCSPGLHTESLQDALEYHTLSINGMNSLWKAIGIMKQKLRANKKINLKNPFRKQNTKNFTTLSEHYTNNLFIKQTLIDVQKRNKIIT